jgi:hypothetical protein
MMCRSQTLCPTIRLEALNQRAKDSSTHLSESGGTGACTLTALECLALECLRVPISCTSIYLKGQIVHRACLHPGVEGQVVLVRLAHRMAVGPG